MRISDWSSDVCSSDLTTRKRPASQAGRSSQRSVVAGPRPDQAVAAVIALDQAGVDRRRERGIVERDRQVRPVGLAGLGPRRAQLVVAGQHLVIGALVAGLVVRDELDLDVDVEGADGARVAVLGLSRSEERRVGKEWFSTG